MNDQSQTPVSAPIPDTTVAAGPVPTPVPTPSAPRRLPSMSEVECTITQHMLSGDGETRLTMSEMSFPLDVHMIDGRYYLRVIEPVRNHDGAETVELSVVPMAVGSKFVLGRKQPLVVRSGGIHFFYESYLA